MTYLKIQFHSAPEKEAFIKKSMPQKNEIIEDGFAHMVLTVDCAWMLNSPFIYSHEYIAL